MIERLADIPEEEIWLAKQKSARTHRAYRLDVRHFLATLALTGHEQLCQVDHRAVIAWEGHMREVERAAPRPAGSRDTVASVGSAVSAASKAAVGAITKSLSKERGPRKIREGIISGGLADSPMEKDNVALTPLGRIGQPDDVGKCCNFSILPKNPSLSRFCGKASH